MGILVRRAAVQHRQPGSAPEARLRDKSNKIKRLGLLWAGVRDAARGRKRKAADSADPPANPPVVAQLCRGITTPPFKRGRAWLSADFTS